MMDIITITGYIDDVIFLNAQNGYAVFKLLQENTQITCVGILPSARAGELVELSGNWVLHKTFGRQFGFNKADRQLPDTNDALVKYLASGLVKGIGEKTALRIVEKFGNQTSYIIENDPIQLATIKGISTEKAMQVGESIASQKNLAAVVLLFSKHGINANYAFRAYQFYEDETIDIINRNPYSLCNEEVGLTFKQADRIASVLGMLIDAPERIVAGIEYVLLKAAQSGSTYLPLQELITHTASKLRVDEIAIRTELTMCFNSDLLVNDHEKIYLPKYFQAEEYVANKIKSLLKLDYSHNSKIIEERLVTVLDKMHLTLDDDQILAIRKSLFSGISIISGGPGTGKTTIIKVLIDTLFMMGLKFSLTAPTGRASKKMEQYSVFKAKTIHRLLEVDMMASQGETVFMKNEHDPLDCDVIIVDEVSMVDILLFQSLLKAIPSGGRLVLVGDCDQLPAIGPGLVLSDLLNSEKVPYSLLTKIYRQEEFSLIPQFSQDIISGKFTEQFYDNKEIINISCQRNDETLKQVLNVYQQLSKTNSDVQLITPSKKGILGTINLNKVMQESCNKKSTSKIEKVFPSRIFREHDKVMQIRKNYNLYYRNQTEEGFGIYNGDIGVISEINLHDKTVNVIFEEEKMVTYEFAELDQLELAYSITVHNSQGSEYDCVIIPLYNAYEALLNRNLFYTAVTRAKKQIYLIGDNNIIRRMINNVEVGKRYSGLLEMLLI